MLKTTSLAKWGVAVLLMSSLSSCEDILEQYFPKPTPPPTTTLDIPFYALAENGRRLDAFSTKNPTAPTGSVVITTTGDRPSDKILGIDFRPATGQLYGVSATSRVYVINPQTGVARLIGSAETEKTEACICADPLSIDFDPTTDRIRVVAFNGRNRLMNPETGLVESIDAPISPRPTLSFSPITAMAFSNNVAGTSSTTLYAINGMDQQLYRVISAKEGVVEAIGKLNLPIANWGGMDIDAKTGTALGLFQTTPNLTPTLFTVDLTTGAATTLAQYTEKYKAIAIPTQPVAYTTYAVENRQNTFLNSLLIFNPSTLTTTAQMPITGLSATSDYVYDIDFRPATGQLYALVGTRTYDPVIARYRASNGRLYTINSATGAATLVAALSVPLNGFVFGFDFNPMADRIRVIGSEGQNLRVNPTDGVAIEDGRVIGATINGAAYDNNVVGAATTNLYVMDTNVDRLLLLSPPNTGTIIPIGPLGVNQGAAGFDIGGTSNKGYAVLSTSARNSFNRIEHLWSIDLATGAATDLGDFGFPVSGTTVGTTSYSLTGFALGLGF
jgi:hypothetical protein